MTDSNGGELELDMRLLGWNHLVHNKFTTLGVTIKLNVSFESIDMWIVWQWF